MTMVAAQEREQLFRVQLENGGFEPVLVWKEARLANSANNHARALARCRLAGPSCATRSV